MHSRFLTSPASIASKRMTFLARVAGRAWSGLESRCPVPGEVARIDRSLAKNMRAMAMGRAHVENEERRAHRSWTTRQ
eukprot:694327-Pyramimonas_sp.AAC.1